MTDEHRYQEIDPELRPTARKVAAALRVEVPSRVAEGHEAMLRARATGTDVRPLPRRRRGRRRTLVALVAAAMLVMAPAALAVASDGAVPGGVLYGVDRAVERLELVLARGDAAEARVHVDHATERLAEIEELTRDGRPDLVVATLETLQGSTDDALTAARSSRDALVVDHVLEAVDRHVGRLQGVRDRLAASDRASPKALEALDRAIDAGDTAREAVGRRGPPEDGRGRGGRSGGAPPRNEPTEDRPGQAPSDRGNQGSQGPPEDRGRHPSGPSGGQGTSAGEGRGAGVPEGNPGGGPPTSTPGGP